MRDRAVSQSRHKVLVPQSRIPGHGCSLEYRCCSTHVARQDFQLLEQSNCGNIGYDSLKPLVIMVRENGLKKLTAAIEGFGESRQYSPPQGIKPSLNNDFLAEIGRIASWTRARGNRRYQCLSTCKFEDEIPVDSFEIMCTHQVCAHVHVF